MKASIIQFIGAFAIFGMIIVISCETIATMKTFTFKESEIRKAGLANDSSFSDIRKQLSDLTTLVNQVGKERSERLTQEDRQKKIDQLKAVEIGATIYLTNNNWSDVPYGTAIIKVKDGRKYMTCQTDKGKFNVPYTWLSVVQPDESTIQTNRQLVNLFK